MSDCGCEIEVETAEQARVLWIVLAINFAMFLAEATAGLIAGSVALLADSADMLADAAVYALSLFAVRRGNLAKARTASMSGILQLSLGAMILVEAVRRIFSPVAPEPGYMIVVASIALAANVVCLRLIAAHKDAGVHMRASVIFSENDVIANAAVVLGGLLVFATSWDAIDLFVGAGIAIVVLSGGVRILRDAKSSLQDAESADTPGAV